MKVVQADEEALARVLDSGRESGISHSPSLRTGRADLPHPALQSVVGPARGVMNDQSVAAEHTSRDRRPGRLGYPSHHHEPALGPALSAPSTSNRVPIRHSPKALGGGIDAAVRPGSSTSLRSLRSLAITPLPRYCGRSDSCPPRGAKCSGSSQPPLPPLLDQQVSLIHALSLPALPSPTTCGCSALPGHVTHPQVEPRLLPHGIFPNRNSELHPSLAGSPHHAGRIEFSFLPYLGDFLRTGRSPPAALHPVSRRRRCSRLQVTLTWRGLPPLRLSALSGAQGRGFSPATKRAPTFSTTCR